MLANGFVYYVSLAKSSAEVSCRYSYMCIAMVADAVNLCSQISSNMAADIWLLQYGGQFVHSNP